MSDECKFCGTTSGHHSAECVDTNGKGYGYTTRDLKPIFIDGVCCQYCQHFEQLSCPVHVAEPWSRLGNFCNCYSPNPEYEDARQLAIRVTDANTCKICGNDYAVAEFGEKMGFRPDIAIARAMRADATIAAILEECERSSWERFTGYELGNRIKQIIGCK